MESNKIAAIISGYGELPLIGVRELKKKGYKVVVVALKESATYKDELKNEAHIYYEYSAGQVGTILKTLKKENVTHGLLAGKVEIGLLHSGLKFDLKAIWLLTKLKFKSTDTISEAVIDELKKIGIKIISQKEAYASLLYKGQYFSGSKIVDEALLKDIKEGFLFAKHIGKMDLGQSIVIGKGKILAVESAEGTDKTFARGISLAPDDAVCIKTGKEYQDDRFDLPTVGIPTLKNIKDNGGKILVVEAEETLIIDLDKCIEYADKNNITFLSISKKELEEL